MTVYPEKLSGRQEARAACGSQFWEQEAQTARTLEGTCQTLPCEPAPLQQCAYHGLNRTQQLVAAQALFLPAVPAYDSSDGGLVLDRVMFRKGGKSWWTNLGCRARAGKIVRKHRSGVPVGEVLRDLEHYGLSGRLRFSLGKACTVNTLLELPNVRQAEKAVKENGWKYTLDLQTPKPVYQGQAVLKYKLPGHELKGVTTKNREYLDSAATYSRVSLANSLDLASNPRGDGIHYRAGLHQVVAPKEEVSGGATFSPSSTAPSMETSLHFQGAVAVEGEATLWRRASDKNAWPHPRRNSSESFDDDEDESDVDAGNPEEEAPEKPDNTQNFAEDVLEPVSADEDFVADPQPNLDVEPGSSSEDSEVMLLGVARHATPKLVSSQVGQTKVLQDKEEWAPIDWRPGHGLRGGWRGGSDWPKSQDLKVASNSWLQSSDGTQPETAAMDQKVVGFKSLPTKTLGVLPFKGKAFKEGSKPKSQFDDLRKMMGTGPILQGVNPAQIQRGMQSSKSAIDGMRASLNSMTSQLRANTQAAAASPAKDPSKPQRKPYSILLAEPYVKVNGAIGCLARVPMPCEAFGLSYPPANGANGSKEVKRGSRWSQELWTPYVRDTALRVFASCGLSAQIGRFSKRFADFTAASLRLDLGLTSPDSPLPLPVLQSAQDKDETATPKSLDIGRHCRHRAFALEGRGIWHAASMSLTQQIWGPIRARVDSRVALDITSQGNTDGKLGLSFRNLAAGAPWVQPVFLETVWGLDVVIPGSQGAARACAWYSPVRKEGMIEMQLC